jgi:DNA-binding winged helix-turn-helix (wHTH) protein/tetratricopeptide (TPR) repeat protein
MQKLQSFWAFYFDTEAMILARGEELLPLGRRGALILKTLLDERGKVVSKDRLLDAAWPGLSVEESNLSVQIAKLRQLVGAHWIRTVERVGYQFAPAAAAERPQSSGAGDPFPVIALPDEEATDDPALDRLGRALRAELLVALARFRTLHVTADRADDQPADYRVALSVHRRPDGSIRAVPTLSDGMSGRILWARRFDIGDPPPAADGIAAGLESPVQAAEYATGPRGNQPGAEAYGHYLTGRRVLNSSLAADNATAFEHFMAAVRLAPDNATYLAAASEAMHHRISVGWESRGPDDKQVGRELAYRTLALAGDDAVALALVGNTLFTVDEEDLGLALCRRAYGMNPTSQLVLACALHAEHWGGSLDAQASISRRAIGIATDDPGQRFALGGMATASWVRGDYADALAWTSRSLAFGPGYSAAHWVAIASLVGLGRQDEAERRMQRFLAIAPGVTARSVGRGQHFGDRSRLMPLLNDLRRAGLPAR